MFLHVIPGCVVTIFFGLFHLTYEPSRTLLKASKASIFLDSITTTGSNSLESIVGWVNTLLTKAMGLLWLDETNAPLKAIQ